MAISRGKEFEHIIRESFEKVSNTSVVRLHDQTNGYKGGVNICDFIVYHYPYQYFIECKTTNGTTLPFSNITDNQWKKLFKMSDVKGVIAGVLCWWVKYDTTLFLPIQTLYEYDAIGYKSVRFDLLDNDRSIDTDKITHIPVKVHGRKKRIFFEYDMQEFFNCF